MKSVVVKRSVVIAGHKTSITLEDAFWNALKEIAAARQRTVGELMADIDAARESGNLSSALRLFVLHHIMEKCRPPTTEMPSSATQSSMSIEAQTKSPIGRDRQSSSGHRNFGRIRSRWDAPVLGHEIKPAHGWR
jgi:predicted DNA-binding ribbon-helix-helix protein